MTALLKGATSVLIALALIAIIGTGVILYFNNKDNEEEIATTTEGTLNDNLLPGGDDSLTINEVEESTTVDDSENVSGTDNTDAAESSDEATVPKSSHSHNYIATVGKDASCTVIGKMLYTCACGDYYLEPISTVAHTPGVLKETKEATKTADGLKQQRCTVCNTILKEEVIPKLPATDKKETVSKNSVSENEAKKHNYVGKVSKEPTCTENGVTTYTCKDKDCDESYTKDIPGLNHPSRQTIVTDAVCGTDGTSITSCALCKVIVSHDTLVAPDHDYGSWKVTKQPTTTALGEKTRTCRKCKEKETGEVPMVGASGTSGTSHTHVYSSATTTAAACTTAGVMTYTCTCSVTYTEEVAALEHNPGNWQTVTAATEKVPGVRKKFCRRCALEVDSEEVAYVPTHNHVYTSKIIKQATCTDSGTKEYTCTSCGDTYQSTIDPTGNHTRKVNPSNADQYICSVCGIVL